MLRLVVQISDVGYHAASIHVAKAISKREFSSGRMCMEFDVARGFDAAASTRILVVYR